MPGFDLFASLSHLSDLIQRADIVVTAEGRIDASSLMGKGVGGVLGLCRRLGKPCVGLAGHRDGTFGNGSGGFLRLAAITDTCDSATAQAEAAPRLQQLAQSMAEEIRSVFPQS